MKSFSKRVASFAMAAAMVLSLAAVSPVDAQAAKKAKKASIEKKSSITAEKTYTYKIKNVTSKQYVKVTGITSGVTVKYNGKTVKKNSTKIYGKKSKAPLALRVTAKDKIANYKATIKAQVYNKSNNKKVGSLLKTTTTVKCTKLAIKSVEPATLDTEHKYIVVSFNRALDSLDPSEVSIRRKDTNQLVTVEKVALASNGKSATLTLLGDKEATHTTFVKPNVDYVLTVNKAGVTADMDFNFPDVLPDVVVTSVDATKRTFNGTYTVPTTISVDFQDILGRTVTFWFNKNNEITKLVVANETVVYGAFTATAKTDGTREFADKVSDAKYLEHTTATTGTIYQTKFVRATGKGLYGASPAADPGAKIDYAKLVLNPNGTIRAAVYEQGMLNNRILVASVAENVATESKNKSVNLKDYTIVKDGKTIAIADIQAGDVLFYNAGDKYAEVYTTKVTGTVTNVTDKKVTVGDKTYEYYNTSPKTSYVENNESKAADSDYFVAVKKAAKDATLYLDRTGKVVYASGDKGTVATSTRDIILTDAAKTYSQSLESYIRLAGSDGTTTAVPEIKLSELKTVVYNGKTYSKDKDNGTNVKKVASFDGFEMTATGDKWTDVKFTHQVNSTTKNAGQYIFNDSTTVNTTTALTGAANIAVLTLDSTNTKVTGIEIVTATTTLKADGKTTFEKGKSTIVGQNTKNYQIVSSTPVYEINKDSAVSKVTYGEYAKKTLADKAANVKIFADNKGNVTKIVIDDKNNDTYGITDTATKTGVVIGKETLNGKVASFTIVSEGQKVEFTSFVDDYTTTLAEGDIVDVEYEKSSNKVKSIKESTGAGVDVVTSNKKVEAGKEPVVVNGKIVDTKFMNNNGAYAELDLASSITPTIVMKDGDNWKVITYGELSDLVSTTADDKQVTIKYHLMVEKVIDYIVVTVGPIA